MLWDTPPPPLGEDEEGPAKEQEEQPVRQAETWAHRCPESKGGERLDNGHPSFKTQIRLSPPWKSCWILLHPGPQALLGTPLCSHRTQHMVLWLSACLPAPQKGRGTCLIVPQVNGWARWSTESWAPSSLKLAIQWVKDKSLNNCSPACCSDECSFKGRSRPATC